MTDTPKDLTAPERVDKSIGMCRAHGLHNTEATIRAQAAKLEAEQLANGHEKRLRLEVIAMEQAATARAEAAEAELADMRALHAEDMQLCAELQFDAEAAEARALEMEGSAQAALAGYEAEREARQKAEAERDAALGVLQEIADGNPTCDSPEADAAHSAALARAFLAARQKGGAA